LCNNDENYQRCSSKLAITERQMCDTIRVWYGIHDYPYLNDFEHFRIFSDWILTEQDWRKRDILFDVPWQCRKTIERRKAIINSEQRRKFHAKSIIMFIIHPLSFSTTPNNSYIGVLNRPYRSKHKTSSDSHRLTCGFGTKIGPGREREWGKSFPGIPGKTGMNFEFLWSLQDRFICRFYSIRSTLITGTNQTTTPRQSNNNNTTTNELTLATWLAFSPISMKPRSFPLNNRFPTGIFFFGIPLFPGTRFIPGNGGIPENVVLSRERERERERNPHVTTDTHNNSFALHQPKTNTSERFNQSMAEQ